MANLVSPITANGSYTLGFEWNAGDGVFTAQGTFGSGTLTLQFQNPGSSVWTDVGTDTTITTAGGGRFTIPAHSKLQVVLSGATNPSIYVNIQPCNFITQTP